MAIKNQISNSLKTLDWESSLWEWTLSINSSSIEFQTGHDRYNTNTILIVYIK